MDEEVEADIFWNEYNKLKLWDKSLPFFKKMTQEGIDITNANEDGETALHIEAGYLDEHQYETLQYLIEMKSDVNVQDECGETPLFVAISHSTPCCVQLLLETKADPALGPHNVSCLKLAQIEYFRKLQRVGGTSRTWQL